MVCLFTSVRSVLLVCLLRHDCSFLKNARLCKSRKDIAVEGGAQQERHTKEKGYAVVPRQHGKFVL